jgi:hypothetical protein
MQELAPTPPAVCSRLVPVNHAITTSHAIINSAHSTRASQKIKTTTHCEQTVTAAVTHKSSVAMPCCLRDSIKLTQHATKKKTQSAQHDCIVACAHTQTVCCRHDIRCPLPTAKTLPATGTKTDQRTSSTPEHPQQQTGQSLLPSPDQSTAMPARLAVYLVHNHNECQHRACKGMQTVSQPQLLYWHVIALSCTYKAAQQGHHTPCTT